MARGAKKGDVRNPKGKPAGVLNKKTVEFKEAVNNLISFATPHMVEWLRLVAEGDKDKALTPDPSKALDHIYKFAQYGYALHTRTDGTHTINGNIGVMMVDGI